MGDDVHTFAVRKDGTEFPCVVYVIQINSNEGPHYFGLMREGKFPQAIKSEMKLLLNMLHPVLENLEK